MIAARLGIDRGSARYSAKQVVLLGSARTTATPHRAGSFSLCDHWKTIGWLEAKRLKTLARPKTRPKPVRPRAVQTPSLADAR
jgi:hypothetical protein